MKQKNILSLSPASRQLLFQSLCARITHEDKQRVLSFRTPDPALLEEQVLYCWVGPGPRDVRQRLLILPPVIFQIGENLKAMVDKRGRIRLPAPPGNPKTRSSLL